MRILDAGALAPLLPYARLVDELRTVLRLKREGRARSPVRSAMPVAADGTLLLMPATDGEIAVVKLITVHPHNRGRGLPVSQASVLVLDAATGRQLLLLDGTLITARRTAAVTALAATLLAPEPAGPALIIGAGAQARAHLEALSAVLGVSQFHIAARRYEQAEELVEYGRLLGLEMTAEHGTLASIANASDSMPLIVTATRSAEPLLAGGLHPKAFIAAVGAFTPHMAEVHPQIVGAARLFVDTLEGARAEAGDLIQAGVDWAAVTPLELALELPRPQHGPVLFKSVGDALWDLAAARAVLAGLAG